MKAISMAKRVDPMAPDVLEWIDATGSDSDRLNAKLREHLSGRKDARVVSRVRGDDSLYKRGISIADAGAQGTSSGTYSGEASGIQRKNEEFHKEKRSGRKSGLDGFDDFVNAFENTFKKKVVFYRDDVADSYNAFVHPLDANTIWVNVRAQAPIHALLGHELGPPDRLSKPAIMAGNARPHHAHCAFV